MRKSSPLLFLLLFSFGTALFAQEAGSIRTSSNIDEAGTQAINAEIIIPEDQHLFDMSANVKIEYSSSNDEARIFYECLYITYDRGDAMSTTVQCLADFQDEKNYYGYKYLSNNKETFFKDSKGHRYVQYISYVKFYR
ncbi:MAG: hypothetical protein MJ188_00290 [Treponema sp.]|nr:hypothetical protein [Treponema sp.]